MTPREAACQIDDLTIDFTRRKVLRQDGSEIALSALSFDTLKALIVAAPAILSTGELIDRAWRGSVVSNETVTQRIRLLRKSLQDESRQPRYIETIRNVGYRLVPPVAAVIHVEENQKNSSRFLVSGLLSLFLIGAGTWFLNNRQVSTGLEVNPPVFSSGPVTAVELVEQAELLAQHRTPDSLRHAIGLYEQALELDPGDQMILTGLSLALSTQAAWYGDDIEAAERAERLARQAAVNGAFFGAEFALAFSLDAQGKISQAQAAYERAVALDPDHSGARASLAYLLQVQGKLVEALSHNMVAYKSAPAGTLDAQIASCLRLLGFNAIASEWLDRANRLNPGSPHAAPVLALDLITQRDFTQGKQVIEMALARGIEQVELYEFLVVLALLNEDKNAARDILKSVPASISHRGPFNTWRIIVDPNAGEAARTAINSGEMIVSGFDSDTWPEDYLYTALLEATAGHTDEAIVALQHLSEAGYRDYLWLQLLPPFEDLLNELEFIQITSFMRDDVERQHKELLTVDWIPSEWRTTEPD